MFGKFRRLNVLVINGHVGIPIRFGAIQWILRTRPHIHVICAQEIRDRAVLVKALGPRWLVLPSVQPGFGKDQAMTYVCLRRRRFEIRDTWNDDITHGEKHHRRMTAVSALDKVTKQVFDIATVHVAPLGQGLVKSGAAQRAIHARQLAAYVNFFDSRPPTNIGLAGGDFNENVSRAVPVSLISQSAVGLFRSVRMAPAHGYVKRPGEVRLMELFLRPSRAVQVAGRTAFRVPVRGMDHEAVIVRLRVRKK